MSPNKICFIETEKKKKNNRKFQYFSANIKMSEDWCVEQLAKLQIKERRLDTLNEIRTQLGNIGPNEVSVSAKFLSLLDSIDDYRDR